MRLAPDRAPSAFPQPVDEAVIESIVHAFYARVRLDPEIGPIFNAAVHDWPAHLERLCAFWSSVMLTSGRYKGSPMEAHMRLGGLAPRHFARWLELFRETAATVAPEVAPLFIAKADRIADSLQLALFYRPGEAGAAPRRPARRVLAFVEPNASPDDPADAPRQEPRP